MPEGDTVYRAARLLDRSLSGQLLTASDLRVPRHATADLAGAEVLGTVSRGKHLLTRVSGPGPGERWTLHTHLKMEGTWRVYSPGQPWRRPAHQARVVLRTARTVAVGFSLGVVDLLETAREHEVVGHLGPDLLGPDWDEDEALRRLTADPDQPLVTALLDQRNLAGIGNMYAAELCFVSGVHPSTPVGEVGPLPRLVRRARQMLDLNKERAVQSTTGRLAERERMWVYRRDRSPCRRCSTPIRVAMTGPPGRERATYWCPRCQPEPGLG
ncbi:Fpg/Nei family DNA glycosylase [Nocardioides sp. dk4132]|uniref:DNA-formamidopyrimidine glycosylase family protein n=1 Tax=unclassified Nocardioides TaxID=2615069 RepID=UPI0012957208|nr:MULTISPECIES: DNA-formamidopyrimidine glycosylase family protein [unclassified Nocardioides]MQW77257.1 Fpg/Nei family DNA glycosylase [Nocardioides sp. dk4132]QGA08013.1 Fpg/Nei family DNA glycosylase [Nocardioides sp. dk884]